MTDQKLKEIKARLAEWETSKRIRATSKPNYAADHRYALAVDDLNTNAPADIATLLAEVRRLRGALEGVRVYGSDTLSGRADGGADDREWQREAVLEMTKRARAALEGK